MPDVTDDVVSALTPYLLTSSLSRVLLNATLRRAQLAPASVTKDDLPRVLSILEELLPTYLTDARKRAECTEKLRRLANARQGQFGAPVPPPAPSTSSVASAASPSVPSASASRPGPFVHVVSSPTPSMPAPAVPSPAASAFAAAAKLAQGAAATQSARSTGGAPPSSSSPSRAPTPPGPSPWRSTPAATAGAGATSAAASDDAASRKSALSMFAVGTSSSPVATRPAAPSAFAPASASSGTSTGSAANTSVFGSTAVPSSATLRLSGTERILVHNGEDVRKASGAARDASARVGFSPVDQTKIATAASELARNILLYAKSGEVRVSSIEAPKRGVEIIAIDEGPGIGNVDLVLGSSYKSRTGMGMGLKGTKRLMDHFDLQTAPGKGTTVVIRKFT